MFEILWVVDGTDDLLQEGGGLFEGGQGIYVSTRGYYMLYVVCCISSVICKYLTYLLSMMPIRYFRT